MTMHRRLRRSLPVLLILGGLPVVPAQAHCGSAFCLVNTSWEVQGLWSDAGSRLDLRYEYIDQDTMKHGRGAGEAGAALAASGASLRSPGASDGTSVPDAHHDEAPHEPLRTLNRVTSLSYDHSFSRAFGVSVIAPWVARSHDARYGEDDQAHVYTTDFSKLGDVRVIGRWEMTHANDTRVGLRFGAKLATGSTDVPGPHGEEYDRNLQPGSGTTDAILGVYANGRFSRGGTGWFAQATAQSALAQHAGYAPGNKLQLDGGLSHTLSDRVLGLVQLNASWSGRDRGPEAAPDDSGQRSVSVSPGINVVLAPNANLYAFVERPLWRRVNGEQLVAGWAGAVGVNWMF